ncbi:hypothetical protein L1887_13561 [Cichorium endivia]|nr:hypothetical protein L1887_13561 [Cichorium endivia]
MCKNVFLSLGHVSLSCIHFVLRFVSDEIDEKLAIVCPAQNGKEHGGTRQKKHDLLRGATTEKEHDALKAVEAKEDEEVAKKKKQEEEKIALEKA